MTPVLQILARRTDPLVQQELERRAQSLYREIVYHKKNKARPDELSQLPDDDDLAVICDLAAYYQVVLVRLSSVQWKHRASPLGAAIPIRFGRTLILNRSHLERVAEFGDAFQKFLETIDVSPRWLTARDGYELMRRLLERRIE
jgi:hypothetical protein